MNFDKSEELGRDTRTIYDFLSSVESNARTYARDFPIVIKKGQNAKIVDTEDKIYIDCLAGAGTLALGHNNPFVVEALKQFLDSGHIMHGLDFATPVKSEFVKALFDCFPENFRKDAKIQFCGPTGTDAVEAAIKLFKIHTKRSTVLAFHGGYHGVSHGTLALTGNLSAKNKIENLMPGVHFLPYPYRYRCPFGIGSEESIDVNLNYIKNILHDPESGIAKPAAIIVEIIQGEGGCIPADDKWVRGLRQITYESDIPLIVDEIQTGLGRTGYMFAFESSGIIPDAVLVSKAVGGGLPLSAVVYNKKYDTWSPGAHAGTFRGNQMAMVAGIATIKYIKTHKIIQSCREKGEYLLDSLRDFKRHYPIIGDVRGRGLMIGIEIIDPTKKRDPMGRYSNSQEITKAIKKFCFDHGLIIESGGRHGSVLRLLPPLVISDSEIEEVLEILKSAIHTLNEAVFNSEQCLSV